MPKGLSNIPTDKVMFDDAVCVLELTDEGNSDGWTHGICPVHNDEHPSFAIREADDGGLIPYCFSGCSAKEIYEAIREMLEEL